MDKLWHTKVQIYGEKKYSFEKDTFLQEEVEIALTNDTFAIINDSYFTKLTLKKDKYMSQAINEESISVRLEDRIFGSGISYSLYSTYKPRPSTVKAHIEAEIQKKIGWLGSFDLSIIK